MRLVKEHHHYLHITYLHITDDKSLAALNSINSKLDKIMGSQAQLAADLAGVTAQVAKIKTETQATLTKVSELEAALANQENVSPELQAAVDALKAQVNVVDELIPDNPAEPATPPTE